MKLEKSQIGIYQNYAVVVGKSHRTSTELFLISPWDYRFCKKKVESRKSKYMQVSTA